MADTPRSTRGTPDQIGDMGELLAALALSRPVLGRYRRSLFKPTYLGEKYPAADFLVDALSPQGEHVGFFFVQVKSTSRPSGRRRLRLTADTDKLRRLARLPAPTYVVGVDTVSEAAYIAAAFGPHPLRSHSLTKQFPLSSDAVRIELYREVLGHWATRGRRPTETRFTDV